MALTYDGHNDTTHNQYGVYGICSRTQMMEKPKEKYSLFRLMTHASSFLTVIWLQSLASTETIHSISIQLIMFGLMFILCNVYVQVIIGELFSMHFVNVLCCPLLNVTTVHSA